jgi:hypothetical protein
VSGVLVRRQLAKPDFSTLCLSKYRAKFFAPSRCLPVYVSFVASQTAARALGRQTRPPHVSQPTKNGKKQCF